MKAARLYLRSLGLLAPQRGTALLLAGANIFVAIFRLAEPMIFGHFVDLLFHLKRGAADAFGEVRAIILLWVAIGLAGIAINIVVALYTDRLSHICRLAAARKYFEHILSLPYSFHSGQHSGTLTKVMYEAIIFLFTMWMQLFREQLASVIMVLILFPLALYLNWQLSLLLLGLVAAFCAVNAYMVFRTEAEQRRVHAVDTEIGEHIGDVVGNVALVQSFTRAHLEVETFGALIRKFIKVQFPILNMWAVAYVLTRSFSTITVMLIFLFGTYLFEQGSTSIGEIVTFSGFATILIARLEQLTQFFSQLFFNRPVLAKFFEILDTKDSLAEREGAVDLANVAGDVRFENISFTHGSDRLLIQDMSFHVPAGTTVALVGRTGAGKSTVLGLLCRFWDPEHGRILIDGIDIRDVTLQSLRRNVGLVFQDNPVLYRSVEENFRVGKPDATEEELDEIVELVQLEEFVMRHEGRYKGRIGERGRTISGGERQRLGIARALLKNPPILILDEATSALDPVTEEKIRRSLDARRHKQTTLIVAHRLSTVRYADVILVLDDGRIVERGSYDDLVRAGGTFAALVAAQASRHVEDLSAAAAE